MSATKGIEEISLRRMSQVISEALRVETLGTPSPVAVLSGPTFAREIAAGEPAAIVIAAAELGVTHGAVSRQIASLEEWLGQPLFVREGQSMVASPGRDATVHAAIRFATKGFSSSIRNWSPARTGSR